MNTIKQIAPADRRVVPVAPVDRRRGPSRLGGSGGKFERRAPMRSESGILLPSPPTEEEKYAYINGGQQRWALVLSGLAFGVIAVSLLRFAASSPWLYPFLFLMIVTLASSALGLITSTRRRRLTRADHDRIVANYRSAKNDSVDVFLPSAGEPIEIIRNTFLHVANLEWEGELNVYVLDDSARDEVAVAALEYGFRYLTRPNRGHLKKAGNLKFGFENSDGDFILVFDADFVPRPDMLLNMVPYMQDPTLGIVQSPQFFDGEGRGMNWLQHGAGVTQELFYRRVQPSRDKAGAPICVGTNALYRRHALNAAGGFAQIGHSEDVHTGVNLRKAGYFTRYVQVNLAKGLCPDELGGFINQQYRWCTGSMSLLADATFHRVSMNLGSRLAFWSGFSYYITTAVFVFTMPLPTITMLFFFPHHVQPLLYAPLLPGLVVAYFVLPKLFFARWTPAVLRVQMVYSFAHAFAVIDTLRGKTAAWVPTGSVKKGTPIALKVQRTMRIYITATLSATVIGLGLAIASNGVLPYLPLIALTAFSIYVKLPAILPIRAPRS